ncbi:N,N-dimethylformamidase beta subunit family domain-containing protein [Arthrobacter sp. Hor0625]|uniref:N,N-dimethylformamidase beta subunit family domain-containing protein n=1 Tax=Arthrobacter sp. Hor0625 TaxID=3457358 RepID=UPI00403E8B44
MGGSSGQPARRTVIGAALAGLAIAVSDAYAGTPRGPATVFHTAGAGSVGEGSTSFGEPRLARLQEQAAAKRRPRPVLEGFLGQHASTARQRKVDVYVNSTVGSIRIRAYRIGHYSGEGQRLVWTSGPVKTVRQRPYKLERKTRMVSCPWKVTTTVDTTGWPDGFYYLALRGGAAREHRIPLVVESGSVTGKAVLVFNDCTMQAYNAWGGYSLYAGPGRAKSARSYKVSFDRPYRNFEEVEKRNAPLVRAAEAIDDPHLKLAYTTEARITGNSSLVNGAAAVIFSAHSEYWSPGLRRTVERARDRGTNIVFFGANNVYWRTRLEPSARGKNRILVCYRNAKLDPYRTRRPAAVTTQWRQGSAARPESTLTGSVYGDLRATGTFTVSDPGFFAFAGTGAVRGTTYAGLTSGETDRVFPAGKLRGFTYPKNLHIFAHSPQSGQHARHGWSDSTFYTVPSGAGVINMGTLDWLQALGDTAVPARSRAFALRVTQNIIREAGLGRLGQRGARPGPWHRATDGVRAGRQGPTPA